MTVYNQISTNRRNTFLLIFLFLILLIFLGWLLSWVFEKSWILYFAIGWAVLQSLVSYYWGDKIILRMMRAKPISKRENPRIWRLVENLAITAGLPAPKIYLIPTEGMNAFATGRSPKTASIALTQGLIKNLNDNELEGVIAHELSHIKNEDIKLMTVITILVGIVVGISDIFLRTLWFSDRERREGNILALVGLILMILSPIFAYLLQMAISRKREFLADAGAVLLTRYPEGLISALLKISQNPTVKFASAGTAHLFIVQPLKKTPWFLKIWMSHPPIEERILALKKAME